MVIWLYSKNHPWIELTDFSVALPFASLSLIPLLYQLLHVEPLAPGTEPLTTINSYQQ